MVNVAKLQETMDWVETHPEHWDQSTWMMAPWSGWQEPVTGVNVHRPDCDTFACIAGRRVIQDGYIFVENHVNTFCVPSDADPVTADLVSVSEHARSSFGITEVQADALFDTENDREIAWVLTWLMTGGTLRLPPDMEEHRDVLTAALAAQVGGLDNLDAMDLRHFASSLADQIVGMALDAT